jgi:abhydrolase domain-containing protein 12
LKLPILILHGYEDNVLPIIHGETLYQEVMNSAKYETTTITQGIPQSVQVFSSEKKDHLVQFAKFKHIDHDNFHRFDTVFLIIQNFWDKINQ